MAKLKTWIKASRPRTMLLSFSGVLLGGFLALFEVPEPVEGPTPFAFQMGDELVVNGSGTLEVIDLLGRAVRTERLDGTQSTLGMPDMAKGVYVLRLTTQNGTRTQKIVLQ